MPTEVRHILFRPAEVIQAVREYCRRSGRPLPTGSVLSCAVENGAAGGAIQFRIKVALDAAGGVIYPKPREIEQQDLVIESPNLTAALILYCNARHVPLPAKADKSLQRFGEQIGLVVNIGARREGSNINGMRL